MKSGMCPKTAKKLRLAAALHDIGKIGISKSVTEKPGKLTVQEFEIMKTHTIKGVEILKSVKGDLGVMARNIALWHHERWDGNGYWGKRSCDLPQYVSIVTLADVFTALVHKRVYKEAWPPKEALRYIENGAGTQFCPEFVRIFITLIQDDNGIAKFYKGVLEA